jgi:transcriptional regulator with XRE-family HTH domain
LRKKPFDFEPQTLGERIKKRRLELGLSQKEAGTMLKVTSFTVLNWEKCRTAPPVVSIPALLQFLGYDPFPKPQTIPEHLIALRRSKGWSLRDAAQEFGVDEGTWRDWESGKTILHRRHRELIAKLFGLSAEEIHRQMGAQWIQVHLKKI